MVIQFPSHYAIFPGNVSRLVSWILDFKAQDWYYLIWFGMCMNFVCIFMTQQEQKQLQSFKPLWQTKTYLRQLKPTCSCY